jgi:hypothetical protein
VLYLQLLSPGNGFQRHSFINFGVHAVNDRRPFPNQLNSSQVKVKVTLRLTVSQSVSLGVEPHLGLMTRYLLLFDSYGLFFSGAPSLTRGRVCLLYMLLALDSVVLLGSEVLGTLDHILLSQI